jgi:DNA polymerase-3 subunit gamma/tau
MLYEKHRPYQFSQVIGQDKVISVLKAQSKRRQFVHSYLFFGDSGTGKTSTARIMAMAMNCTHITNGSGEPCGECEDCLAIRHAHHWDVLELDSGRFRGIDDIRSLAYKANFAPIGNRKVYILDECQQFTNEAWNSLLKLLEEPPPHLCLILCTTNGLGDGKIPETVISRCELYPFVKLGLGDMKTALGIVAEKEGINLDPSWLTWVTTFSQGNLRIALAELGKQLVLNDKILVASPV